EELRAQLDADLVAGFEEIAFERRRDAERRRREVADEHAQREAVDRPRLELVDEMKRIPADGGVLGDRVLAAERAEVRKLDVLARLDDLPHRVDDLELVRSARRGDVGLVVLIANVDLVVDRVAGAIDALRR